MGRAGAERRPGAKSDRGDLCVCTFVCIMVFGGCFMSKVRLNIKIGEDIHTELKIVSFKRRMTMSHAIETLVREWLQGNIDIPDLREDRPTEEK